MSLVNENDLIIPRTVGTIEAAAKEANRHLDRYRGHAMQDENRNKNIAEYIKEMPAFLLKGLWKGPAVKNMALKTSTIFLSPPRSGKARPVE